LPDNTGSIFTTEAGLTAQPLLAPVQLPVIVTANGLTSQTGVSIWVAPSLAMTGPNSLVVNAVRYANTVSAQVGVALLSAHNSVFVTVTTPTQGTGNITYTVTSGLLPSGLSIDPASGLISGIPAAGTEGSYTVTVTATDSAQIPVTGTNTFVVTVASGLFTTTSTPAVSVFGSGPTSVALVTASGGIFPYHYAIANQLTGGGTTLPVTLTINAATGQVGTTAATPPGTYAVVVTATDSTSGTPLQGKAYFNVVVGLHVTATPTGVFSAGGGTTGAYNTVLVGGGSGSYTYALNAASTAILNANAAWLAFSNGIFTVSGTSVAGTYNFTIIATDTSTPTNSSAAPTGATVGFTVVIAP
jgi:hypothetical protein